MLKTLKNFTDGLTAKTILIFALVTLPFIILPFMIVSNSQRTDARINAPQIIPANAFTITTFLPPSEIIFPHAHIGYDRSVLRAVREMGLVLDHLNMWIDQYPDTALSHVIFMPVAMQQNVASIALFIRKTNARIDEKTAWREAAAFVHYSAKYGVPVALTTAVAKAESTFDPDAQSPKGASGVMQVMWKIHQGLLNSNGIHASSSSNPLSDPEKAIAAGSLLLSRYLRAYGSLQAAMNRYSGGASSSYLHKVNRNIASIMNHHAELMK